MGHLKGSKSGSEGMQGKVAPGESTEGPDRVQKVPGRRRSECANQESCCNRQQRFWTRTVVCGSHPGHLGWRSWCGNILSLGRWRSYLVWKRKKKKYICFVSSSKVCFASCDFCVSPKTTLLTSPSERESFSLPCTEAAMGHSPGWWEMSRGQLWCSWERFCFPDIMPPSPLYHPCSNVDTMPGAVWSRKSEFRWARVSSHLHSFLCEKKAILT